MVANKHKVLVVGAGLAGATVGRILAERGYLVDIIDKRNHIAGNAYDYVNKSGFRIHKYGPHIFHTSNKKVFDWLSRFTEWVPYKHKVKALLADGTYVTLPPNRETRGILGSDFAVRETLYRPYTKKMWGLELEDLDPKIKNRVPFRSDDNIYYFPEETYQCLPAHGYTKMVYNILDIRNISLHLNTAFKHGFVDDYCHVFNSMPIDEYFDFKYGALPYRSIKFEHLEFPTSTLFPVATVNFTHTGPQTRVTEWRHFPGHGGCEDRTALTYEVPCDYQENNYERYYPIKDINGANRRLYKKYRKLVPANMTFIGRCGQYVYLDMHQAVASSISVAGEFIRG